MNVAVTRTDAETALLERFESVAGDLPGDAANQQARREAIGKFAELGLPHRRIEEWKYTDLRQAVKSVGDLAVAKTDITRAQVEAALGSLSVFAGNMCVLVDGSYSGELSTFAPSNGLYLDPLADGLKQGGHSLTGDAVVREAVDTGVVALNTAYTTDGVVFDITEEQTLADPLLIVHVRSGGDERWTTTRNVLEVGPKCKACVIEAFVALDGAEGGHTNAATSVMVDAGAELTHVKIALEAGVTHVSSCDARIGSQSNYRPFLFTAGPALTRNNVFVTFQGEDSKLDCSGAFLGRGADHIDNTLTIDHAVPGCESRELFKGVLDDRARGVFQGKVIVRQIAQKTDGKQMAQALMLSPDTEFDSKPELEIYADDVACGHGSTCTEVDEDHIFYLRARGIAEADARALLVEAFINEAIEQVEYEAVAEALSEIAQDWLRKQRAR